MSPIFKLAALPIAIGILAAQTYDVASIHKSDPAEKAQHMGNDGPQGGLRSLNTSVVTLIAGAYDIDSQRIVDAPAWASTEHYDVILTPDKPESAPNWKHNQQRLQAALRDRFGLVLRTETRQLPIYALVQAKNGNKLSPHSSDKPGRSIQSNNGRQITATDATMEMLAQQLSMHLGRPVHDQTGLDGHYDLRIEWTPDPDLPAAPIFTAIDQLGLRLESTKGPVLVYVVEKLEHPTDN